MKLGLQPEDCLVVEDAVNGVKAAKAAGCKCLALTTSFKPEDLSGADWIAKDLREVIPDVSHLFQLAFNPLNPPERGT